jgi:CMP-N,N'-diacetyllegionaminic acid synthase
MNSIVKAWALVPARGGSKSIIKKNLAPLGGRPLIEYGICAAKQSGYFQRIICSTDDREIANIACRLGVEVDWRPAELATDDSSVADVAREFLWRHEQNLPAVLGLIQPTSPFLLPAHVKNLIDAIESKSEINSGQTIVLTPHNSHAWNQRFFEDQFVRFMFPTERRAAFRKQQKPKLFSFGNFVAAKPRVLLEGLDFFAQPSVGVVIEWPYNMDIDGLNDLRLANAIISAKLVELPDFQNSISTKDR